MANVEIMVLFVALAAAAFASWRLLASRREVRQDQSHVATLIGTATGQTVSVREEAKSGRFTRRLKSAGVEAHPAIVFALLILFGVIVALLIASVFPGVPWAYPVFAVVIAFMTYSLILDVARWRSWKFENRLADAIDLMVGALSAGETPVDAMASAAAGSLEPVRSELTQVAEKLRASVPVERALRPIGEKYDSEGVRLFSQLMVAKWEVGGPLAPALQAVNRTMRQGIRLRNQLQTQVSAAQNAAVFVAIMPYIIVGVFIWKTPALIHRLWAMPWGPSLFFGAILLQVAGFLWLRKLLRTEL